MQQTTKKVKQVPCPNCKALSDFSPENAYRPFCSARCQMIDLGDWANETYRIPEKTPAIDLDDLN
ncbi:MAG: DNA gyrase inhibitor YacG [Methylophilaceae bacterium]|nr:DNA gyrase inhibitor YacG [Methylophilaceae bacterium]MDG1445893.1 DNA gyrase inhibitor YacG [Methylophilaceae bacterium]MDG1821008.1 DNA gyrase inhibitor YacG [Methylophilaceae bacterium]MDG2293964.1 DNA gyrase inhibitor YacG [Methylophilaceae bacterium]